LGGALAEEIQYAREREVESDMCTMRVYLCYDVHTNDIIKDQRSVAYSAPRNTVCIWERDSNTVLRVRISTHTRKSYLSLDESMKKDRE